MITIRRVSSLLKPLYGSKPRGVDDLDVPGETFQLLSLAAQLSLLPNMTSVIEIMPGGGMAYDMCIASSEEYHCSIHYFIALVLLFYNSVNCHHTIHTLLLKGSDELNIFMLIDTAKFMQHWKWHERWVFIIMLHFYNVITHFSWEHIEFVVF